MPQNIGLIAVLGLWLVQRSLRRLWRQRALPVPIPARSRQVAGVPDLRTIPSHGPDHGHSNAVHCEDCGHAHGPTLSEMAEVTRLRDAALLIGGVALRPCTGALFLLILTWQLGIGAAGIAGTFAMGVGTALVTIAAALTAIWAREGVLAGLGEGRIGQALPILELAVGLAIVIAAAGQFSAYF
jgi:nickel/cobalt transporter (NicO) family protein